MTEPLDLDAIRSLRDEGWPGLKLGLWLPGQIDALADEVERLRDELEDIASGDWRRYPNGERHGCTTVEAFARFVLASPAAASEED